jgi:asparagine N-glycosylation enzyme membrane subunit Stt3
MNDPRPRYWFPAKRYGWGWGLPCSWQGWVVFAIYLLAMVVMTPLINARAGTNDALLFAAGMTALLLFVVYKKGEPPGWRWGD